MARKNETHFQYKGYDFIVYQNEYDNWIFNNRDFKNVDTHCEDLEVVLNGIYSLIDEVYIYQNPPERHSNHDIQVRPKSIVKEEGHKSMKVCL